jgi:D-alanyl-D-alanine carboxypeptidase
MKNFIIYIALNLITFNNLFSQNKIDTVSIKKIVSETVDNKLVFGSAISISTNDQLFTYHAGNFNKNQPHFIASTTKLYVTALILQLKSKGKLKLDDKISNYLTAEVLKNLHIYKGKDFSSELTIKHLLAHTSGLPDYFEDKKENGRSLLQELTLGIDQEWTCLEAIELSKKMKPKFIPGTKKRAFYSDTNFQLLSLILESFYKKDIVSIFKTEIIEPLELKKTYLYSDTLDKKPINIYFKEQQLSIPKAMSSFKADGGIVSTTEESIVFLKSFFNGTFFPKEYLNELYEWNKIMYPLENGIGLMRFNLPKSFTMGKNVPILYGHSGLSGAFAYYAPETETYYTGTVNQINKPGTSYKLLVKILLSSNP